MNKFAFALAAVASFASAPAHATYFYDYGNQHHGDGRSGCGGDSRCDSPLQGNLTYDGNGGNIADATSKWVGGWKSGHWETTPSIFTSNINVSESFSISDVNVSLNNFEYDRLGDVQISLTHGSTVVWLVSNKGGNKEVNGNYVFDDSATILLGSGGTWKPGAYLPKDSLSAFNGLDSAGIWTLKIYDTVDNNKAGELCDWTLQLTPTPTSAVPEPAAWAMMIAGFGMVGAQMRRRRSGTLAMARA